MERPRRLDNAIIARSLGEVGANQFSQRTADYRHRAFSRQCIRHESHLDPVLLNTLHADIRGTRRMAPQKSAPGKTRSPQPHKNDIGATERNNSDESPEVCSSTVWFLLLSPLVPSRIRATPTPGRWGSCVACFPLTFGRHPRNGCRPNPF